MDTQEQYEQGKAAEDFLRYTQEHPYFEGLLHRIKLEMASVIISLTPQDKDRFSETISEMRGIDQVLNAVRGDIYLGGEAFKQIEGIIDENKGIL